MSVGGGPPMCARCAKNIATRINRVIGGYYCAPCDDYVQKPDRKLEERYTRRVAARKETEAQT